MDSLCPTLPDNLFPAMKNKAGKRNESSNEKGPKYLGQITVKLRAPMSFHSISCGLVENSHSQPIITQCPHYFFPLFSLFSLSAIKPLIFRDIIHFRPIFTKTVLATSYQSMVISLFSLISAKICERSISRKTPDFLPFPTNPVVEFNHTGVGHRAFGLLRDSPQATQEQERRYAPKESAVAYGGDLRLGDLRDDLSPEDSSWHFLDQSSTRPVML